MDWSDPTVRGGVQSTWKGEGPCRMICCLLQACLLDWRSRAIHDLPLLHAGKGKSTLLRMMAKRQIPVPNTIDVLLVEQEIVGDER